MIMLRALECFPYNNKTRNPGDIFEAASESDAHVLKTIGKAEDAGPSVDTKPQSYADKVLTPEEKPVSGEKRHNRRGRYNRADMRAEDE